MPEAPAWKFRKIIKPLFDDKKEHILIKARNMQSIIGNH